MPITIIPKSEQAPGGFNNGAIMEKRPIIAMRGFPHLKPYSNLFYWAHAWSEHGSTIGEHPHQAFEIMSFVLRGDIEHYDSKNKVWKKLKQGDVQVIRSGNGISHSEKINAGSAIFQIWLDPDVHKAIEKPASYDDYASELFDIIKKDGVTIKNYYNGETPMHLDTEGVLIREIWLKKGAHPLELEKEAVHSFFVIEGTLEAEDKKIGTEDFFIIKDEAFFELKVSEDARLFHIQSPAKVEYHTYAEMMRV